MRMSLGRSVLSLCALGLMSSTAVAGDWMDDAPPPPRPRPAPVQADSDADEKKMKLGIDLAFVIPVGDWSDFTGVGLGGLLRFEYKVADNVSITARAGYIGHFSKTNGSMSTSTSEMPLIVPGIKAHFGDAYVAAEIGLVNVGATVTFKNDEILGNSKFSNSEMKFALSLGVGYEISDVDLRLGLFVPSVGDFGESLGVMFNVGYTFLKF